MNNIFFLSLLFLTNLFGNIIIHEKVQSAPYGIPVPIQAFLKISESDIHRFTLLYRSYGNIEYIETPMIQIGQSAYQAEIPGEFCMREFLEYYPVEVDPLRAEMFLPVLKPDNDGYVTVPDRPGLGFELNMQLLNNYRVA